jgi:hypothetical protein
MRRAPLHCSVDDNDPNNICLQDVLGDGDCLFYAMRQALTDYIPFSPDFHFRHVFQMELSKQPTANIDPDHLMEWGFEDDEIDEIMSSIDRKQRMLELYGRKDHWGNEWELTEFQRLFRIGIILFTPSVDDRFIQCDVTSREPYEFYITIYYNGINHYEVATIYNPTQDRFMSCFRIDELPSDIKQQLVDGCGNDVFN